MINSYVVDFDKTFTEAILIAIEPKMTRTVKDDPKSPMEQAKDKDGVLKWAVSLTVVTQGFEKVNRETIQVTITSPAKPYGAVSAGSRVSAERFEVGFMVQNRSNGSTGFSVFYSAEAIRPMQPIKAVSGQ